MHVARGEYLVLLNNDAVVTDGWLDQLIALAKMKTDHHGDHGAHERKDRRKNHEFNESIESDPT